MALIRIARTFAALLLVAISAPAGGATVRSAPMAGSPAPVVAVAPPVAAGGAGAASAPVAATDDDEDNNPQTIPAEDLLAPDGTLRPDGTFNGAVDISGWHVTLDPDNGPIFSPQALTYTWENLGTGVEGVLNGEVYAIAISGTNVYVGGRFTDAGNVPGADYIARWDGAQWHAVGGANAISGSFPSVNAIAISGTDVYVGGFFLKAGGVGGANHIARWDGAQWHAVGGANAISFGSVESIVISGTNVYVGGFFFNAGGVPGADYIARWNGATWSGLLSGTFGISSTVQTIAISGTDVYVGGFFFNAGNVPGADYIARWDGAQWSGLLSGTFGISDTVQTIAISGTDVLVGGRFTDAGNDANADYIARWDGTQWHALGSKIDNGSIQTIAVSGTDVYVGGFFFNAGGVPGANYIARWNGTSWNAVGGSNAIRGFSSTVNAIAITGTDVYVGGFFTNAGGNNANDYITRWTGSAFVPPGSDPAGPLNGIVYTIAVSGSDVYVGGSFTNAGNVPGADHIARWDGTSWSGLLSGTVGIAPTTAVPFPSVRVIAISDTEVLVGGAFTNAGGVTGANYIARWNGATWSGLLSGTFGISDTVHTIAISGTDVYVGGEFTEAGNVPGANYIARWDGTQWHTIGGANAISGGFPDTIVRTIAISGTNVYVGGDFTNAGGVSGANHIARWDGTQWHTIGGANAITDTVYAIAITGTDVYVGGDFTNAGGVSGANHIARWNGTNWNAVGGANAINSSVRTIVVNGNDVYVGGDFTSAGGVSRANFLARWDGVQWTALISGTAGVLGVVFALAVPSSDEVYAGGVFINAGNNPFADHIARYALATKRVHLPLITRQASVCGIVMPFVAPSPCAGSGGGSFRQGRSGASIPQPSRHVRAQRRAHPPTVAPRKGAAAHPSPNRHAT